MPQVGRDAQKRLLLAAKIERLLWKKTDGWWLETIVSHEQSLPPTHGIGTFVKPLPESCRADDPYYMLSAGKNEMVLNDQSSVMR